MKLIQFTEWFNLAIAVILTAAYFYQLVYLVIGLVHGRRTRKEHAPSRFHRFAAIIPARNEEAVIGELVRNLKNQNYPKGLLDVYVIADNCTDETARIAREAGARVYERENQTQRGKGYALDYFFHHLSMDGRDDYDGYFVFDADNLIDPDFTAEMNKTFDTGKYDVLTCYRNSKNFGSNWISAGYSISFLREARLLNLPRMLLGTNCHISGTGFLVSGRVIRENRGWPFYLLTEDIQFSVDSAIKGYRIGYCGKAVVYDEQPTTFRQSWDQRLRWSKGFYQVDAKYSLALLKNCLRFDRQGWSCYDMFMTVAPGMLLTLLTIAFNGFLCLVCLTQPPHIAARILDMSFGFIFAAVWKFYAGLFVYGLITVLCEWRQIQAPAWKKLVYLFTFPLFMFTYIPISLSALVRRVEWKPIYHSAATGMMKL